MCENYIELVAGEHGRVLFDERRRHEVVGVVREEVGAAEVGILFKLGGRLALRILRI